MIPVFPTELPAALTARKSKLSLPVKVCSLDPLLLIISKPLEYHVNVATTSPLVRVHDPGT